MSKEILFQERETTSLKTVKVMNTQQAIGFQINKKWLLQCARFIALVSMIIGFAFLVIAAREVDPVLSSSLSKVGFIVALILIVATFNRKIKTYSNGNN